MKTTIDSNGWITFDSTDAAGKGQAQTMTLEQYSKHARDLTFVAGIAPADVAKIPAAIAARAA